MTEYYLCIMLNIKPSFQVYKKVALSNSSNFRHKVVKKFIYLFILFSDKKQKAKTRV